MLPLFQITPQSPAPNPGNLNAWLTGFYRDIIDNERRVCVRILNAHFCAYSLVRMLVPVILLSTSLF